MKKYISISEDDNSDWPIVGVINTDRLLEGFKEAVEAHFDAELLSVRYVDANVNYLSDCIQAEPIQVVIRVDDGSTRGESSLTLAETWLY